MDRNLDRNADTAESPSLETVGARGLLAGELSRGRTRRKFVQGAVAGAGGIVAASYVKPSLRSLGVPAALASVSGAMGSPEKPIDTSGPGDTKTPPGSPEVPGESGKPGQPGESGPGVSAGLQNAPTSAGGLAPGGQTPGQPAQASGPEQANAPGIEVAGITAGGPIAARPALLPGSAPSGGEGRPAQLPAAGDWAATPAPMVLGALLVGGGLVARFSGWLGRRKRTVVPLAPPATVEDRALDN
ncbi:MAG: hypothetical protein M3069_28370 [Chloroflexota bacterium]|nr:hypothetical protein [Chloroflexota bacterium]